MNNTTKRSNINIRQNVSIGLLILRIIIGGAMLLHGLHKLQAPGDSVNFLSGILGNSGLPGFLAYGVFVGEVIAPILILIGWRLKIGSALLAFTMLIAIFTAHASDIFSLTEQGGWAIELQSLYLFGAVALFFTGAGQYAVSYKSKWD